MKKVFSCALVFTFMVFMVVYFAVEAWDNTMTDTQVLEYVQEYPNNKKLIKIAVRRGLCTDADADPYGIETYRLLNEASQFED